MYLTPICIALQKPTDMSIIVMDQKRKNKGLCQQVYSLNTTKYYLQAASKY